MFAIAFVSAALLLGLSSATIGVDISQACGEFSCLKSSYGVDFSITRAWMSYGAFDSASITNLNNAAAAGIPYNDVYLFPCRGKSASSQVDTMMADLKSGLEGKPVNFTLPSGDVIVARGMSAGYTAEEKANQVWLDRKNKLVVNLTELNKPREVPEWRKGQEGASYGMVWMDIEVNPSSGCGWGTSYSSNCDYLQQLIEAVIANGGKPGVYSSEYEWETVMGSRGACTAAKGYPLWYAHYDNSPSFSDWSSVSFGGWSSPAIKQYAGDVKWCSFDVDADYY
jgi:hypothetical protein